MFAVFFNYFVVNIHSDCVLWIGKEKFIFSCIKGESVASQDIVLKNTYMTKTTIMFGVATLLLGVLGVGTIASAYQGDPALQGPNYSSERHEAMQNAFEDMNYADWKELMVGRGRVTEVISEDNFAQFVRAHNLAQAGDLEEAKEIRHELGLGQGQRSGQGFRNGGMQYHKNQNLNQNNNR